jgi:predicted phage tail protein
MLNALKQRFAIQGAGSGGGSGGGGKKGGKKPVEDPDSLRSRSDANIVAVLSEGEILGFEPGVDPLTRLYLDGIPIKNNDGSFNYTITNFYTGSSSAANGKGSLIPSINASIPGLIRGDVVSQANSVMLDYRVGTQNQDPMPGFDNVKAEQSVSVRVTQAQGTVSRTTIASNWNRIRIRVGVGALFFLNKETGDVKGTKVEFNIKIRPEGGGLFINENKTISGKSRGSVDFEYEYDMQGAGPWVVSIQRLTGDPTSSSVSDDFYFKAIVGYIDSSFRYPNTALLGLKIGAESFTQVPSIGAELLGVKIKVPTNYDPFTRTYQGIWNGTFKTEWSNNPAWVFYDLLTNTRYGAGEFIDESQVDRYSLYSIAQYCDELVPDGKGGKEPRMTFNAYITDRGEAYDVLNSMAAAFRGMLYFSEGTIVGIQDKPKSISKIFSPSNVIQKVGDNGEVSEPCFSYEGTARKARKTVALISWNDPDDQYSSKIEYVEDRDGVERYGYREAEIRAFGTTSQGQAQRVGRWLLLTDQLEYETVTFKVATEGFFILPGEIVGIADPAKGGKRSGGRLASATTTSVSIDAPFTIGAFPYLLYTTMEDGSILSRTVVNSPGEASTLLLSSPLPSAPLIHSPWILQEGNAGVRKFRVISMVEDNGEVTILGTLYDERKFSQTDSETMLGTPRIKVASVQALPVVNGGSITLGVPS